MKKTKLSIVLIIATLLFACGPPTDENSNAGKLLEGKHKLRRFQLTTKKHEGWSASYFLFTGHASGGKHIEQKIKFAWQAPTGEYVVSELPLTKIRVKLDSTIKEPYVTFRWTRDNSENSDYLMDYSIQYMVVYCTEEDYPMRVNIDEL